MPDSSVKMMLDAAFARQQPPDRVDATDTAALLTVAEAALSQWGSRRPGGWSLEQQALGPLPTQPTTERA
jgi:hypothetical protein